MGRWSVIMGALLLRIDGGLSLPSDNSRGFFRDRPTLFHSPWEVPLLMTGAKATREMPTDMVLHSADPSARASRADRLYPSTLELDFEAGELLAFCRRWWWASYVAASLYLVSLWLGGAYMKDRPALDLKVPLALWNLFLAVFSLVGALRTVPHLALMLSSYGLDYTVCRAAVASYGSGAAGFWVALFIFSKYFELADTAFLVLRKKSVPFLHWYHHCSVLLYCWHAYVFEMPTGIYFAAMNYSVHAVMYFYYFLAAACHKPPRWACAVTVMQLAQMAIGILVTSKHLYTLVYDTVPNCDGHMPNLAAAFGMYASYFILFAQFFARRYTKNRGASEGRTRDPKKLE